MDLSLSSHQEIFTVEFSRPSPTSLLKQGFDYFRQGRHLEGISLWVIARERLPPEKMHLAATIDAFLESYAHYREAEQAFHQAGRNFVEAENKQQKLLLAVEKVLIDSTEESISASTQFYTPTQASNDFQGSRTFHSTQPLVADLSDDQSPQPLGISSGDCDEQGTLPALNITCFGRFEVRRSGRPVALCSNRSGQSVLRFLVVKQEHYATSDTLQALLWPEDSAEAALNKLHIAISALRRALNHGYRCEPGCGYIVCKNRIYYLNPAVVMRTDVDEFLHYYQAGQQANEERIALYESACHFYTGPFLSEDLYADWSSLQREELSRMYLTMCKVLAEHYMQHKLYEDAAKWTTAMLKENRCDEAAHRQLMQIYAVQGRRSEALQQYQRCKLILYKELALQPLPETVLLFQTLLANEPSSN